MSASRRGRRWRSTLWPLRRDHAEYVAVAEDGRVDVVLTDRSGVELGRAVDGWVARMDRRTARLLARRINDCLERTA